MIFIDDVSASATITAPTLPDFKIPYNSMDKIFSSLSAELATIHVGRISTDMYLLSYLFSDATGVSDERNRY